jgi:hypothetical protein
VGHIVFVEWRFFVGLFSCVREMSKGAVWRRRIA